MAMRSLERAALAWLWVRIASAAVGTLVTLGALALVLAAGFKLWQDLKILLGG